MKRFIALSILTVAIMISAQTKAQDDKSKRPSPPASVSQKITSGATIKIDYSQPALKGRTIGKDVEPMEGQVWRVGANEATVFSTDKNVTIGGKTLPAGKYSLWGVKHGNDFTFMFNKKFNVWGTMYEQNKSEDVLSVKAQVTKDAASTERLTYTISPAGEVTLKWGTMALHFNVK